MSNDSANWMSQNHYWLGGLALNQLVMPASHDSGMYVVNNCVLANACNTQTQTGSILDQLNAGSRYFDVRPVLYNSSLHTGHCQLKSPTPLGCNGPPFQDYFSQVRQFMDGSGELVILKFSHYYNRDSPGDGFSASDYQALVQSVSNTLGPYLYAGEVQTGQLSTMTLGDYMSGGGKVLAVYDALPPNLRDPKSGVFSYTDFPGPADLVVFDDYAGENSVSAMALDQQEKLADPHNHKDNLFLLSWTLTQNAEQAAACTLNERVTILDLAAQANVRLHSMMKSWVENGTITTETIPNLINVDANAEFSLETALYLNRWLHGPGDGAN